MLGGAGGEALHDWKREGQGLARPGLGLGQDVPAGQDVTNDQGRNGKRGGDTASGERAGNRLGHAELEEATCGHACSSLRLEVSRDGPARPHSNYAEPSTSRGTAETNPHGANDRSPV